MAVFALSISGSLAQPMRDIPVVLADWRESQRDALQGVSLVSAEEHMVLTVGSAMGSRELVVRSRVSGGPGNPWSRSVLSIVADSQRVPVDRFGVLSERWKSLMHPVAARLTEPWLIPDMLNRPIPLVEVDDNSDNPGLIRLEARPRGPGTRPPRPPGPGMPPDRVIVFFDADTGALVRTVTSIPFPGRMQITAVVQYGQFDGVDLPVRRTVQGTMPVPRRTRMFTTQIHQETRYSAHEIR